MKSAPPGWQPHKVVNRLDGWIVEPKNKGGVPARVAEMIARAMPQLADPHVAAIRARMVARHLTVLGHV
ncbi:hypothetical protein JQ631_24000 [Bradyrhizobium manausense]|uniref:hypothetical protein n=1 Tax=Bradyrhizobium manausense TaxID=989370 RepID=UPI001BABBDB9|nr:hypothetical protein [Bradyrhizobium manausense]MBR0792159.1 hypothetical protein [Bradyrhizobium manausense]